MRHVVKEVKYELVNFRYQVESVFRLYFYSSNKDTIFHFIFIDGIGTGSTLK